MAYLLLLVYDGKIIFSGCFGFMELVAGSEIVRKVLLGVFACKYSPCF